MAKKRSRAFIYSFLITFLSLAGLAFFLYTNSGPVQVTHLPSSIRSYNPVWGKYVPSDAVFLSLVNYTMITSTNSSLPPPGELVRLSSPPLSINQSDIRFLLEVTLATPNATIDVVFLKPSSFTTLTNTFDSRGGAPSMVSGSAVYPIRTSVNGQSQDGWMAVLTKDGAVDFGLGAQLGKDAVVKSLDVANGHVDSILSRPDLSQLFYIVGGATNHYALDIQNFAGVVRTGQLTLTSVDLAANQVQVSNVVEFSDPGKASSEVQTVRNAYLSAHQFVVYDSYVKAIELHPLGSLQEQVVLAR